MVIPIEVQVGARQLPTAYGTGDAVAAVADIAIEWGRETHLDAPAPKTATFVVVDRTGGDWVLDPARRGERVTIRYTGWLTLWRGTVAEVDVEFDETTTPEGVSERIAIATFVAQDPLAALSSQVLAGPSTVDSAEGIGGWPEDFAGARVLTVANAGASKLVGSIVRPPDVPVAGVWALLHAREPSDESSLELLTQAYSAATGLGSFTYDPHRDTIHPCQPAAAGSVLVQQQSAGVLRLVVGGGIYDMPARMLEIEDTTLGSSVAESIDLVRVKWLVYDLNDDRTAYEYTPAASTTRTASGSSSLTDRTYTVPAGSVAPVWNPNSLANAFQAWMAGRVVAAFDALNNVAQLPAVTVDIADADGTFLLDGMGLLATSLARTAQTTEGMYLRGSMFNGVTSAPSQVQIIGGTLRVDAEGVHHDLNLAPTLAGSRPGAALSTLFPASSADRLDAWVSDLTINDLACATGRA